LLKKTKRSTNKFKCGTKKVNLYSKKKKEQANLNHKKKKKASIYSKG
jgi:hypothetical protein